MHINTNNMRNLHRQKTYFAQTTDTYIYHHMMTQIIHKQNSGMHKHLMHIMQRDSSRKTSVLPFIGHQK